MKRLFAFLVLISTGVALQAEKPLTAYVNPFLGTAPLTNVADIGFVPPWRVWAGLTFPGASLPNAMVQLSPITEFGSGAGYEYEDKVIHAFTHSNKGHWNLCHIPFLPVTGEVDPNDFGSPFNHQNESASPGYYQVLLERYGINAELTTTLRCGYHKYTYKPGQAKKLVVNLAVSNERVTDWKIEQDGENAFKGYQDTRGKVFFYAVANHKIKDIATLKANRHNISVVNFADGKQPLEIKVGLSFTSQENAKLNLERELGKKSFAKVRSDATKTWEKLLSNIKVTGGTERQMGLFYSCLYRSFLWPALRSDVNGEFLDESRKVVKKDFEYYTIPSLWDDYRNKLVLLAMLSPKVTEDVIQSMIDRGKHIGFMPIFFHGDHAAPFISGTYLRGVRGYDIQSAYSLLLTNATVERRRGARPHIAEYIEKGYVSTPVVEKPNVETKAKAGVTKTLEYAYDDYAIALLAKEFKDEKTYETMMKRAGNYTNQFDAATGLMRGRYENGNWVTPFDPQFPYYEYLYREANAWQSSFFAPHDTEGLIKLYPSKDAFEQQLDRLFSLPWNPNHIAMNINSFIGQYCHGNQPDHSFPWLYYWVGKPEKSQAILNEIMDRFYGMDDGLTLCGMDDAGEMSSWYVFAAIGLYPYSPADDDYIISVPIFDEVKMKLNGKTLTIAKQNSGTKLTEITYGNRKLDGFFIPHHELVKGRKLVVRTEPTGLKP
jgi:predicted alpha-1,2-mannosidase